MQVENLVYFSEVLFYGKSMDEIGPKLLIYLEMFGTIRIKGLCADSFHSMKFVNSTLQVTCYISH